MISGVKFWNDPNRHWVQTKNGTEALLKAVLPAGPDGIHHGWLETCGPSEAINVLDAKGHPIDNSSIGGASIRPADFLTMWMNTPANFEKMASEIPGLNNPDQYAENELAQFYPVAVNAVFGAVVEYWEGQSWEWLCSLISAGMGAMICLRSPGHFLAVVAYDDLAQELIYNDSWPGRTGTDGFNLRMSKAEWASNVKPYALIFR